MDKKTRKLIQADLKNRRSKFVDKNRARLPNFVIIGAAKSATTTLITVLRRHPDVFISNPKEPKFFGRNYNKGWKWYASRFEAGEKILLRGEASTMYSSALKTYQWTPELMSHCLPGLKLIYIVRHPLDRIVSQWRHYRGRNPGCAAFQDLMRDQNLKRRIVGCSMYYQQLSRYRLFFPDAQIHALTFEELISSPKDALRLMLGFLGVKPRLKTLLDSKDYLPLENKVGDKGRAYVEKPEWTPALKQEVLHLIRPDAKKMLLYMNKPSGYWEL